MSTILLSAQTIFTKLVNYLAHITRLPVQFVTFVLVGVLNTIVGYLFYAFFVWIGCNYIWAPFFSTVCGVLFNFHTIGRIVFKNRNYKLIGKFVTVYGIIYVLNVLGLKLLSQAGLTNLYIAGIVLLIPLALLGFVLNKKWVFEEGKHEKENFYCL